jgi:hypothetical protein
MHTDEKCNATYLGIKYNNFFLKKYFFFNEILI